MNVNFKKNQKYSWPFRFGLWVARLQTKDLLHYSALLLHFSAIFYHKCHSSHVHDFSDVVFQQELCIEFPPTYVAIRLLFLVVFSEVPLETNFITQNFATILAGSFLTHVHAPQVCDVLKNFHF